MAEAAIPVDLLNPGQVFACIGFVEAADVLLGEAEGVFDWSDPGRTLLRVRAKGPASPILRVLQFLDGAEALPIVIKGSPNASAWKSAWGPVPIESDPREGYPFPDPQTPATVACIVRNGRESLALDYWGDATERDNVKFWAGAGGYPGVALARDALALVRGRAADAQHDPFALSFPQSSSFRFDWRRDYIPIDAGFSLNAHQNISAVGYPLVELLAAIGLTNARPRRPQPRNKLLYTYAIAGRESSDDLMWLPLPILRAALGGAALPFPMRHFRMLLSWPGQENQARSITMVTEENAR